MTRSKPSFVSDFKKPKNTEIKHINGNWYLYERSSVYDSETKKMRKKSGNAWGRLLKRDLLPAKKM